MHFTEIFNQSLKQHKNPVIWKTSEIKNRKGSSSGVDILHDKILTNIGQYPLSIHRYEETLQKIKETVANLIYVSYHYDLEK